jgi:biopolymer transport protein ExbB
MSTLAQLPSPDLTPVQMLLTADFIVKLTIGILVAASLTTWTILLGKSLELRTAGKRLRAALRTANDAATLGELHAALPPDNGAVSMLEAAGTEMRLSEALPADGVKERIAQRLQRVEAGLTRRVARGTGILATVGSCAPFVGLFGTVWGIMNSFVGISRMQTTNLAVVAPGIAEALLATAAGLVAAIPAVVIYNGFARAISGHRALLADLSAAIWGLASRDLDRLWAWIPTGDAERNPTRPILVRRAAE